MSTNNSSPVVAGETANATTNGAANATPGSGGKSILNNVKSAAITAKGAVTNAAVTAKNKIAGIFAKPAGGAQANAQAPAGEGAATNEQK